MRLARTAFFLLLFTGLLAPAAFADTFSARVSSLDPDAAPPGEDVFLQDLSLERDQAALRDAASLPPGAPSGASAFQQSDYPPDSPPDDEPPARYHRRRPPQARQGLLLSFGLGGGSMYVSSEPGGRTGAFDLDFRLGYGFSDRFQMFMDVGVDSGTFVNGDSVDSWTLTLRGQTVLFGDREGNGLNLNLGVGLGGVTYNSGYYYTQSSSASGLALAGGLSYDARVTPWFALSPEFFVTWHAIPNLPGLPQDVSSVYGLRLNFLWYLH